MDDTWQRNARRDERELLANARRLLEQCRGTTVPPYVEKRLGDLGVLISMLEDSDWPLEDQERGRIVAAMSYFADPADLIPDKIPGLGFLDDALMAELVIQELAHELDGYREFCAYRAQEEELRGKEHVSREDWLAAKRRQVMLRLKRQREERRRHGSHDGPTDPILRYMSEC